MGFSRHLGFLKGFMNFIHRFYVALLCVALALITACNPAPLSVVASDFSINGVKGIDTTTTIAVATVSATKTTTTTTASTTTGTGAGTGAATPTATTASNAATNNLQNVTIDLTNFESCSNMTSLVAKVELDAGVTISPNPGVARDYSNPVTFMVTDAYGTKVSYRLTVKGKACPTTTTTTTKVSDLVAPTCAVASTGSTGYSLVFKACDADNVAMYYDKTECVRDNATNLIWEGKTSLGLRAVDNKYNNLDSTSLLQIAANTVPSTTALPARSPTQAEIDAPDNTVGYKNNVNALSLCGSNRWRLPTFTELQTMRLPGASTQIDMEWFANTNFNGYYATSTQFGSQVERSLVIQFYEKGAATVDNLLRDGTVWHPTLGALALREHSVRLVRSLF